MKMNSLIIQSGALTMTEPYFFFILIKDLVAFLLKQAQRGEVIYPVPQS